MFKKFYLVKVENLILFCGFADDKKNFESDYMSYCQFHEVDPQIEDIKIELLDYVLYKPDVINSINRYLIKPLSK